MQKPCREDDEEKQEVLAKANAEVEDPEPRLRSTIDEDKVGVRPSSVLAHSVGGSLCEEYFWNADVKYTLRDDLARVDSRHVPFYSSSQYILDVRTFCCTSRTTPTP